MGKKNAFLFSTVFLFLIVANLVSAATSVSVLPGSSQVLNGSSFNINVSINTNESIYAAQFDLLFNQTVLNANTVLEGDFLKKDGNSTYPVIKINNSDGKITFANTRTGQVGGVTGTGNLAIINFSAKNIGTSNLGLTKVKILDPNLVQILGVAVNNGSVNVTSAEFISITVSNNSLTFGGLSPETSPGIPSENPLIITIDSNTNYVITKKANAATFTGPGTLNATNLKSSNISFSGPWYNYSTTEKNIFSGSSGNGINHNLYNQLTIPAGTQPGDYTLDLIYKVSSV